MVYVTGSNNQINPTPNDLGQPTPYQLGSIDNTHLPNVTSPTPEGTIGAGKLDLFEDNIHEIKSNRLPPNNSTELTNSSTLASADNKKEPFEKVGQFEKPNVGHRAPPPQPVYAWPLLMAIRVIEYGINKKQLPKTIQKNLETQRLLTEMRKMGITDINNCTDEEAKKMNCESAKNLKKHIPCFRKKGKAITDIFQIAQKVEIKGLKNRAKLEHIQNNGLNWKEIAHNSFLYHRRFSFAPSKNLPEVL